MKKSNQNWVISVGGNWGHFFFYGTEEEAEEMRCHKANWEHAMTKKRLATERCPAHRDLMYSQYKSMIGEKSLNWRIFK